MIAQEYRKWIRATRGRVCPICGHNSWCSASADGTLAICMRIDQGSKKQTKNGGFLHLLVEGPKQDRTRHYVRTITVSTPVPSAVWAAKAAKYVLDLTPARASWLANNLGVTVAALHRLKVGYSIEHGAYSFPMFDHLGNVVGIRLRKMDGSKFAVAGGHEGLFIPDDLHTGGMLVVVEGASDAAAGLDRGLTVVGRPSCTGGTRYLTELVQRGDYQAVAIIADADAPGLRGAAALASVLRLYATTIKVLTPPGGVKDLREWTRQGATTEQVLARIGAAAPLAMPVRVEVQRG